MRISTIFIFLLFLASSSPALPARAADDTGGARAPALTEELIRQFYADAETAMKRPFNEYADYMQRVMHRDYEIKTILDTENIPGRPDSHTVNIQKRQDRLDQALREHSTLQNSDLTNEVIEIKIMPDGKSALVSDHTQALIPTGSGRSILSESTCQDVIMMNDQGEIQIRGSVCTSKVSYNRNKEP